ncbi:Orexigenic neuropeptide QRFP receptor [Sesbania bispinosa]|nr:Orexigenic neuropeptide QRFP receptor [Sesbania bispinosa]
MVGSYTVLAAKHFREAFQSIGASPWSACLAIGERESFPKHPGNPDLNNKLD